MPLQSALVVAGCAIAALAGRSNLNIVNTIIDVDGAEHNISLAVEEEDSSMNALHFQGEMSNLHLQSPGLRDEALAGGVYREVIEKHVGKQILERMKGLGKMRLVWSGDSAGESEAFAEVSRRSRVHELKSHSSFSLYMNFMLPSGEFSLETNSELVWKRTGTNDVDKSSCFFGLNGLTSANINALASLHKQGIFEGSGFEGANGIDVIAGIEHIMPDAADDCTEAVEKSRCLEMECRCCLEVEGEVKNPLSDGDISITLRIIRPMTTCIDEKERLLKRAIAAKQNAKVWDELRRMNGYGKSKWASAELNMVRLS